MRYFQLVSEREIEDFPRQDGGLDKLLVCDQWGVKLGFNKKQKQKEKKTDSNPVR